MAQSRRAHDQEASHVPTEEREHLEKLAAELSRYDVTTDVADDPSPRLRVGNPASAHAVEDVVCERREHGHAFLASFGVYLGSSGSLGVTAHKVAWLVGATEA
ncbi:hypothetical protein [Nocardiopsis lucentensis]|uniref:hypothetical protein n=1 Tax=Nocardiopsis lucentensis TaxID=53441 RepID=UPI00034C6011|nr:hypothetical protein [Nocardiopsis lucentensis]